MDGATGMQPENRKPKTASLQYENAYALQGKRNIIGLDEAGRGAWAGPVAAGAVWLPYPFDPLEEALAGVRDSKQMTPSNRTRLAERIKEAAFAWGVGHASNAEVDTHGIMAATRLAMERALLAVLAMQPSQTPEVLLLDSVKWDDAPVDCEQKNLVRGDQKSLSIAAASVLAKVWRDEHMRALDADYPGYAFGRHKGYGTANHRQALDDLGVSPVHRRCYRPVKARLEVQTPTEGE